MDNYEVRFRNSLENEFEKVFDLNTEEMKEEFKLEINCPVCDSSSSKIKYQKDFFKFSECNDCGMVYLNPRLNDEATYNFYNGEWTKIYNEQKFKVEQEQNNYDDKRDIENLDLIMQHKSKGNLLEIGIGKGHFLKNALKKGFNVYGVELNIENCDKANTLLENKGTIINHDLFDASFEDGFFDVVYMKDVFEHVPNPIKMLEEINRISSKSAVLFIEVPNIDGAIFKIVKEKHVTVFGFEHLNYWAPKTLSLALKQANFETVKTIHQSDDFTIPYILSYCFFDSHTSLRKKRLNKFVFFIIRGFNFIFRKFPLKYTGYLLNRFVDNIGKGSQIKVLAMKK